MPIKNSATASALELVIDRVFDAPRELVYAAWTDPKHLAHWSGPRGYTTPHSKMEVRPGGHYRACLRSPDGSDHWVQGTYIELIPPERIVMTHAWADPSGQSGHETVITITLTASGTKTKMRFHQAEFESIASREGHNGGWSSSFERLAEHLWNVKPASTEKEQHQ